MRCGRNADRADDQHWHSPCGGWLGPDRRWRRACAARVLRISDPGAGALAQLAALGSLLGNRSSVGRVGQVMDSQPSVSDDPHLVASVRLVGGPTAVVELGGLRLLTDPTFSPPGVYESAPGRPLTKIEGPALTIGEIGPID